MRGQCVDISDQIGNRAIVRQDGGGCTHLRALHVVRGESALAFLKSPQLGDQVPIGLTGERWRLAARCCLRPRAP